MPVYTRFRVLLPLGSTSLLGLHRNQVDPRDTPLNKATYNCLCKKTGSGRYTPTVGSVWPCDLLIVVIPHVSNPYDYVNHMFKRP
jgi:hypothetical protein